MKHFIILQFIDMDMSEESIIGVQDESGDMISESSYVGLDGWNFGSVDMATQKMYNGKPYYILLVHVIDTVSTFETKEVAGIEYERLLYARVLL